MKDGELLLSFCDPLSMIRQSVAHKALKAMIEHKRVIKHVGLGMCAPPNCTLTTATATATYASVRPHHTRVYTRTCMHVSRLRNTHQFRLEPELRIRLQVRHLAEFVNLIKNDLSNLSKKNTLLMQ